MQANTIHTLNVDLFPVFDNIYAPPQQVTSVPERSTASAAALTASIVKVETSHVADDTESFSVAIKAVFRQSDADQSDADQSANCVYSVQAAVPSHAALFMITESTDVLPCVSDFIGTTWNHRNHNFLHQQPYL